MKVKLNSLLIIAAAMALPYLGKSQNLTPYGYIPNGTKRSKVPPTIITTPGGVGYQFSKDGGTNFESYDSTTATWVVNTAVPGATTKLTIIQGPDTLIANASSNVTTNSLRVDTGAFFASRAATQSVASGIRMGGGIGAGVGIAQVYDSAILVNNGSIGLPATYYSTPAAFNNYWYMAMMKDTVYYKLTGTGYYNLMRVYINGNFRRIRLLLDANMDLSYKGIALTTFLNSSSNNSVTDSIAYTITQGKTVRITDSSYWHMSSTSTTVPGGLYIYNINGTLDLSSSAVKSALVPADSNIASQVQVNINGGTLNLPKGGLIVGNVGGAAEPLKGKVLLRVNANGTVNGLLDSSLLMRNNMLFVMTDSSARFRKICSAVDTLFPIGTADTVNNSVRITNTGTADTIAISLRNTLSDVWPAASLPKLIQKQWRVIESTTGGSNLAMKFMFVNADKGASFVGTAVQGYVYTGARWKRYAATLTGAGTVASPYIASISGVDSFRRIVIGDSGLALPSPVIVATSSMVAFNTPVNIASAPQSFTANGTTLSAAITVTPPASGKFLISADTVLANFGTTPITINQTNGIAPVTTIYVRLFSTTTGTFTDSVTLTTTGATTVKVPVTGTVTPVGVKEVYNSNMIAVYPNPVTNNLFMVKMNGLSAGSYTISVFNVMGQKVASQVVNHNGSTNEYKITLPSALPAGSYGLNVLGGNVNLNSKISVQ